MRASAVLPTRRTPESHTMGRFCHAARIEPCQNERCTMGITLTASSARCQVRLAFRRLWGRRKRGIRSPDGARLCRPALRRNVRNGRRGERGREGLGQAAAPGSVVGVSGTSGRGVGRRSCRPPPTTSPSSPARAAARKQPIPATLCGVQAPTCSANVSDTGAHEARRAPGSRTRAATSTAIATAATRKARAHAGRAPSAPSACRGPSGR